MVSQQLLEHVSLIPTPLGETTSYHIDNKTRIKSLITMNNRFGREISFRVDFFFTSSLSERRVTAKLKTCGDKIFAAASNEISVNW